MKYLPIHSSSSIWLRYDNLWTNLNQFVCKHYGTYRVYYAYLTVWYVSISLNLLVFLIFPRPLLRYMGTFRANPVAIWSAIAIRGRCCEWGGTIFIAFIGRNFLLHPHPSIKYCTYTVIISSGLPEALNSE